MTSPDLSLPLAGATPVAHTATTQPNCPRFLELSEQMIEISRQANDSQLNADLTRFIAACLKAELPLPRRAIDMLEAQKLARRVLLASGRYDLVYEWYPLFKQPEGGDERQSIAAYTRELQHCRSGWAWLSGYETVLECGCGAASLGLVLSGANGRWIASDICYPSGLDTLTARFPPGPNFEFRIANAITLESVEDASVTAVVSRSFFEHLLVEDAVRHLANAYRVLKPGGELIIACPAGIGPPSEISNQFPEYDSPQGLHIKEYRMHEMVALLTNAGFGRLRSRFIRSRFIGTLPHSWQQRNFISTDLAAGLEAVAEKNWRVMRRTARGRQLWKTFWGHLGANAVSLIAQKL